MANQKNSSKTRRVARKTADTGTGKRATSKTARRSTKDAPTERDARGRKPGTVNRRRPQTERAPRKA